MTKGPEWGREAAGGRPIEQSVSSPQTRQHKSDVPVPLSVVLVIESFWPDVGGLQRSTQRLGEQLAKFGHSVRVVTQQAPGAVAVERRGNVEIHRYPDGQMAFTGPAAADGLFADADVICVFGVDEDSSRRWWPYVLDRQRTPNAVRLVKPGTEGDLSSANITVQTLRALDGVLCQTSGIAAEARRIGMPDEACFPVRNGVSLNQWRRVMPSRAEARAALGLSESAFCVLGLGRFIRRKRFADLVRAFARFVRSSPSCRRYRPVLLLHGSDFGLEEGEELELRHLVTGLLGQVDVRFVSPQVEPQVSLAAADVMAFVSEREGAPNVFVEAFASGRPVVATNLAGHRVYVAHGREGLLVPVGDTEAQAAALRGMCRWPERREAMASSAAAAALRFDVSRTATDYLHAFTVTRGWRSNAQTASRSTTRSLFAACASLGVTTGARWL